MDACRLVDNVQYISSKNSMTLDGVSSEDGSCNLEHFQQHQSSRREQAKSKIMRCKIMTHDSTSACYVCRETDTKGVDISRHFSMYAFDGGTGNLRWKHEGEDFHKDAAELQDRTVPQHNHRLDAEHLGGRHYGEASCRDFRESVLAAMPHRYNANLRNGFVEAPLWQLVVWLPT